MILTYFNLLIFLTFLGPGPRPRPQSGGGPGSLPPLWGLGLGPGPKDVKKNGKDMLIISAAFC